MHQEFLQILKTLIEFRSITPESAGSIEYIETLLSEHGFLCDVQVFGEGKNKVANLYAIYGNSSPNICFAGHVDVVPPGDEKAWQYDPFQMTIKEDVIYGRGAVDMKGAISVSLAAAVNFIKANIDFKGSISFLLTSDEEGVAEHGTRKMLEYIKNRQPKIDFCILGEPTSEINVGDTIKIGRRGSVSCDLKVIGIQGHAAYPEKADNPIPVMTKIMHELCSMKFDEGSEFFQPTNLEVTSIDVGNKVSNIIPESINAKFNVRFNDKHTAKSIIDIITKIILKYTDKYDLKYNSSAESFVQDYSKRMQEFTIIVKECSKIDTAIKTNGGTSDARFMHSYFEVIEFGLNSNLAHKIDEYTKISDLQMLYNVYYDSLNKFLN
jgi:succinyl-diaminopimelate desuccinylase